MRPIAFLVAVVCCLPLCGCAGGSKDIAAWQKGVQQYLDDKGSDPEVLRDVTLEDNRPGFAVLGGLEAAKSTDVRGLLLAHETIDQRPWFIYLVGIVSKQRVQEIRLVALSVAGGKTTWRIGPRDGHAFKLYRDWGWGEWKQRHGDHSKPPPEYLTFPRASDVFNLTIEGTKITAKHTASGATWVDDVAQQATTGKKKR